MTTMLPCEYCGRLTPWDMRFCVPACCKDCGHMPMILGGAWLVISLVVGAFGFAAWRYFS